MNRILLALAFLAASVPGWAQIVIMQGSDTLSSSRQVINNNFLYLEGIKTAKYSGAGVPGTVAASLFGDWYLDTSNGVSYQCYASPGPCTAVATSNWVKVGATGGVGPVTSVGMTGDGVLFNSSVGGSPVTTSGTLVPTLKTQTANLVLAGPTSGAAAAPTFRALGTSDLPSGPTLCPTCLLGASLGAGIVHAPGSSQTMTSSLIVNADIAASTIDLTSKVTGVLPGANGGITANQKVRTIGAVLTPSNLTSCVYVGFAGTINGFHAISLDGATVNTVLVKVQTQPTFATWISTGASGTADISNGGEQLTSVLGKVDTTLTSWTTTLAAGTTVCFVASTFSAGSAVNAEINVAAN